jgi:hypothetical protein
MEQLIRRADTHCATVYCEPGLAACKADNRQLAEEARMDILRAGAEMLRTYPDYRGVMDLAAALLLGEDHPHRKQPEDASPPDYMASKES